MIELRWNTKEYRAGEGAPVEGATLIGIEGYPLSPYWRWLEYRTLSEHMSSLRPWSEWKVVTEHWDAK